MTDKFKQECKNMAYKNRLGKIELDNETISNSDYLSSFEITDSCTSNGTILGNTNSKSIKVNTLGNYDLADKQINPFIGVKYDDSSEEYIKMGKYTITSETNDKTSKNGEYTGIDSLNKLDQVYVCTIEDLENATILDFYIDVCKQIELTPKKLEFINKDIVIGGNPFTNNESCRIVLQNIAQVFCSFVDIDWETEEIDLIWFDEEISETFTKKDYSTLEKNQIYGPINSLSIKESAINGENVVIEQNGKTIENITIEGSSKQETRSGRNLYDYKKTWLVADGYTVDEDGWITVTYDNSEGTDIQYLNYWTNLLELKTNTTYTVVTEIKSVSGAGRLVAVDGHANSQFKDSHSIYVENTSNNTVEVFQSTTKDSFDSCKASLRTFMMVYAGQSGSITFRLSLIEDTTITVDNFEYESYGASPSPDYPSEIKTVKGIRNLFDKDNANVLNGYVNNNGVISLETARSIYIPIIGGKTYTITRNGSKRLRAITTDALPSNGVSKIDIINNDKASSITISTSTNSKYLVVYFYLTSDENDKTIEETMATIQIEEDSISHDYVPYGSWLQVKTTSGEQEQSTLIDMNKYDEDGNITGYYELSSIGDIKDTLDIANGQVVINKKIGKAVLDGSESWWKHTCTTNNIYIVKIKDIVGVNYDASEKANLLCNQYNNCTVESSNDEGTFQGIGALTNTQLRVWTGINNFNTLEDWKNWLSKNPLVIEYEMTEPETITLNKTDNIELYEGINYISTNDELQPNMTVNVDYIGNKDTYNGSKIEIYKDVYELNEISITDNYFLYTEALRKEAINAIYEKIKGFTYIDCKLTSYTGKPYLKRGNKIQIEDDDGTYFDTYVLSHTFTYDGTFKSIIESPALSKTQTTLKNTNSVTGYFRKVERICNKIDGKIIDVIDQVNIVKDDLNNNYYTIQKTNELVQTSGEGITNTFSEAGGNNVFRNTGLWFKGSDNNWEYWNGNAEKTTNDKAVLGNAMLLQSGTFSQEQEIPNGNYSVSFYYKLLNELATATVKINDKTYSLTSTDYKQFYTGEQDANGNYIVYPIEVTSNHLSISFTTDIDNSVEIYDLMANKGSVKLAYSQNENEITTDTVNISKGITITSSTTDTKFKADSDGIRILNKNTDEKTTEFTDKGMITKEAIVENEATIVKVLIQDINEQTWFTRL